jgi:hypothetical protein
MLIDASAMARLIEEQVESIVFAGIIVAIAIQYKDCQRLCVMNGTTR